MTETPANHDGTAPPDKRAATRLVVIAYAVALAAGLVTAAVVDAPDAQWRTFWADVAATVAVFAFSVVYRNSSFYDAYWSVAPMAIVAAWAVLGFGENDPARAILAGTATSIWGARLTWNWWRGWTGLHHEDWRYVDLQQTCGRFYWPVSFLGIHMMPTLVVFLGCLPLYPALVTSDAPFGVLDAIATLAVATAIYFEGEADNQLKRFRESGPAPGSTLTTGLWSLSRHPNYFGEILFWWALFGYGLSAAPDEWWRGAGALAISVMFRVVSLPMIDNRMLERRPDYKAVVESTPSVLPLGRRTRS